MANPLFERFGASPAAQPQQPQQAADGNAELVRQIRANPAAFVGEIKANPAAFARRLGYNVPDGMTDPRQIAMSLFGGQRG